MRTSADAIAYAISLFNDVTRETFTPSPSSNSYLVTVGPTTIPTSLVSTPCAARALSSTRPLSSTRFSLMSWEVERARIFSEGSFQIEPFAAGPSSISSCLVEVIESSDVSFLLRESSFSFC